MKFRRIADDINNTSSMTKIIALQNLCQNFENQTPVTLFFSSRVFFNVLKTIHDKTAPMGVQIWALKALNKLLCWCEGERGRLSRNIWFSTIIRLLRHMSSRDDQRTSLAVESLFNIARICHLKEVIKRKTVQFTLALPAHLLSSRCLEEVSDLLDYLYDLPPKRDGASLERFHRSVLGMLWRLASSPEPGLLPKVRQTLPVVTSAIHRSPSSLELRWACAVLRKSVTKDTLPKLPRGVIGAGVFSALKKLLLQHLDDVVVACALKCIGVIGEGRPALVDSILQEGLHRYVGVYTYPSSGVVEEACCAVSGIVKGGGRSAVETLYRFGLLARVARIMNSREVDSRVRIAAFQGSLLFLQHGDFESLLHVLDEMRKFLRAAKRRNELEIPREIMQLYPETRRKLKSFQYSQNVMQNKLCNKLVDLVEDTLAVPV